MISLTGDSHVNALRLGCKLLAERGDLPRDIDLNVGMLGNGKLSLQEFSASRDGGVALTQPEYASALTELTGQDSFVADLGVRYGVCLGFHSAPTFRNPMWRQYLPPNLSAPRGRRVVSSGVMTEIVNHYNEHIYRFFDRMSDSGVDFFVVAAPPPRRDHPCMPAIPADVVIAVDQFFRGVVVQRLESRGITSVLPPRETHDEEGFLREEFANKMPRDFHHGNAEYGAVVVPEILSVAAVPGNEVERAV